MSISPVSSAVTRWPASGIGTIVNLSRYGSWMPFSSVCQYLSHFSRTVRSPATYSPNLNGPVPTPPVLKL